MAPSACNCNSLTLAQALLNRLVMITTSTQSPRIVADRSNVPDQLACCETCGTSVDLRESLLLKRNRVVGCSGCGWGVLVGAIPARQVSSAPAFNALG